MPLLESDAIILKTYPLGEADRIVAFFSREHGKVRGVANGARKMKNRFGASLEPLTHSRIQFFEKENRDLVRIQSAEILDSPMALYIVGSHSCSTNGFPRVLVTNIRAGVLGCAPVRSIRLLLRVYSACSLGSPRPSRRTKERAP